MFSLRGRTALVTGAGGGIGAFAWTVSGVESEVGFELAEDEDGTLMTLTHSDLPSFAEVLADTAGAVARCRRSGRWRSPTWPQPSAPSGSSRATCGCTATRPTARWA